jgi:hypothetical protein
MALDVYVKEDILNVLRALHVSSEVPTALSVDLLRGRELPVERKGAGLSAEREAFTEELLSAYQKGFRTALGSVALAFGLVPVASSPPASPSRTAPSVRTESRSTSERLELDLRSFIESMVRAEP